MSSIKQIPFGQITAAMLDENKPFSPHYLNRLSDLIPEDQAQLQETWDLIPNWRRKALLEDLEVLTNKDFVLSFEAVGQIAIHDNDPVVRKLAVNMLAEYENPELIQVYIRLIQDDPDSEVRAAIASALGVFVYQGEVDKISANQCRVVEDCLLGLVQSNDTKLVRQRALESLGYSSRDEIPPLIEDAYATGKRDWLLSALHAMGRSASERWREKVLCMLEHDWTPIRAEAAAAAGELGLKDAISPLIKMLEEDEDAICSAAIWALSQIGGERVRQSLEALLEQAEDEDEIGFLEDALENLSFTDDVQFLLLDLDDLDDDDDNDEGDV